MKVPIPEGFQGKSLLPELRGEEPGSREPILTELSEDSHNPYRRALIEGAQHIVCETRQHRPKDDKAQRRSIPDPPFPTPAAQPRESFACQPAPQTDRLMMGACGPSPPSP